MVLKGKREVMAIEKDLGLRWKEWNIRGDDREKMMGRSKFTLAHNFHDPCRRSP